MRPQNRNGVLVQNRTSVWRAAGALSLALLLPACAGSMDGITDMFGGGSANTASQTRPASISSLGGVPIEQLRADQLCPSIVVRDGTETLRLYAGEEETSDTIRYQSQILQTVVECTPVAGQVALSIGVAGRSIIGPLGTPAALDLPIRLVVRSTLTEEVVFSQVVSAQAIIEPTEVSATFSLVDRSAVIPMPQRQSEFQVIVGFDTAEPG